jgi:hypothetical protein
MRLRAFVAFALFTSGPFALPAGPSDVSASRIPDRSVIQQSAGGETPLVNEREVSGWIVKWQKRLGLSEWAIEAKVVRIADLPKGAVANIHWSLPKRKATIKVLSSLDSNLRKEDIPRDTELSVVHELIHLSMARLPLDPNHTDIEEETVKKISVALLELQDREQAAQTASHTATTVAAHSGE